MIDLEPYRFVSDSHVKATFSRSVRWPFSKMKVGQVIEISDLTTLESAVNAYLYVAKKKGWKFQRRTICGCAFIKRMS